MSGNNPTIQRRQLLRPYPEFDGVQKQLIPEGRLCTTPSRPDGENQLRQGVSMLVSYTFSRSWEEVDPLNAGESRYKQRSNNDRPNALRLNGTWMMPKFDGHSGGETWRAAAQTAVVANIRTVAASHRQAWT